MCFGVVGMLCNINFFYLNVFMRSSVISVYMNILKHHFDVKIDMSESIGLPSTREEARPELTRQLAEA